MMGEMAVEVRDATRVEPYTVARVLVFGMVGLCTLTLHPWTYGYWWGGIGSVVLVAASVAALAGSRTAGWVTVAVGVPVLAIPQWDGSVSHYHHILWFAVVLLVGRDGPWLRCLWALFGFIYLVPGVAKFANIDHLIDGGMGATFDRVRVQHEWTNWIPSGSWFPAASAVAVTLVELALPVLIFTRWRRWAVAAGFGFHLSAWWVLGIPFFSLLLLYPILWFEPTDEGTDPRPVIVVTVIVAMSLIVGGNGWPFATYPKFAG